ncbi:dna-directed rna polymerases i ii and iii subunit rpabc2 [Holotrichia oblita]|uniref:Dna-directed rna polymerases i ii and iii subunit rpabc2 n=1 Tax=Holotrichia oblita TaxID=644536 RepID=A0ACB9TAL9_HOLOL|nr:dna-directed rna polymerases i ii and iii subunit rpabc2 [Holotrichia oblita]
MFTRVDTVFLQVTLCLMSSDNQWLRNKRPMEDREVQSKLRISGKDYAPRTNKNLLMNLISVLQVSGRCHGTYNDPAESHRQGTMTYTVPDGTGRMVRVCKTTFMGIFAVSKVKVQTIIRKKKSGETSFTDKRTYHKLKKFTSEDKNVVKQHILSIPRQESHYSTSHTSKEYLIPDLNIHRLFKAFAEYIRKLLFHISFRAEFLENTFQI